jgi:hemerythrin-like metal-binding protein
MPDKIHWEESFDTGIDEIDAQHQRFVELLNELGAGLPQNGENRELELKTLDALRAYGEVHFALEERILEDCGYPDLATHRAQHNAYRKRVGELRLLLDMGHPGIGREIYDFMNRWLRNHILYSDKQCLPFLLLHGMV